MQRSPIGSVVLVFLVGGCTGSSVAPPEVQTRDAAAPACESSDDCIMSCVEERQCCPNPCGCDVVRHVDTHAAINDANAAHCATQEVDCPDVGACDPNATYATPRCVLGKCVAELAPQPQGEP